MGDIQWGGLMVDKAKDAAFLLTGAGTWVGKSAYLTTDPVTIQEGKRAIAQAVSDNQVRVRGSRHPHVKSAGPTTLLVLCSKNFPSERMCLEIVVLTIHSHLAQSL